MENTNQEIPEELVRKKAGRKPIFKDVAMQRINIYVDEITLEKARSYGNVSEFFRLAADEYEAL